MQGRWEPLPLISPDAVKRLDDKKTLLQVRGHHGVILDKLNFYTQSRFTKAVEAAASYDMFLQVPVVLEIGE